MAYEHGTEESLRLVEYFTKIGEDLGNRRKREVFAMYARGLMSDCERKSFAPIAAQAASVLHFRGQLGRRCDATDRREVRDRSDGTA
jgi:SRSO17 transposase